MMKQLGIAILGLLFIGVSTASFAQQPQRPAKPTVSKPAAKTPGTRGIAIEGKPDAAPAVAPAEPPESGEDVTAKPAEPPLPAAAKAAAPPAAGKGAPVAAKPAEPPPVAAVEKGPPGEKPPAVVDKPILKQRPVVRAGPPPRRPPPRPRYGYGGGYY